MQIYSYFRSSASWRVRIALALKGLNASYVPVHLVRGEQHGPALASATPTHLVPALVDGDHTLHQSLAIIEYLDETHPMPPLLPALPAERARVRALALDIACEIHPLANLRVLQYLQGTLGVDEDAKLGWIRHWVESGLAVVERQLAAAPTAFCHGDVPGLADCVLVPQVFNAQRFGCRTDELPHVMRVNAACLALPAFAATAPSACPDAA